MRLQKNVIATYNRTHSLYVFSHYTGNREVLTLEGQKKLLLLLNRKVDSYMYATKYDTGNISKKDKTCKNKKKLQ